jgi:hypothetical protein
LYFYQIRCEKVRLDRANRLCTTERKNGVLNHRARGVALDEPAGFSFCGAKPVKSVTIGHGPPAAGWK